jgi:hypothetical protein
MTKTPFKQVIYNEIDYRELEELIKTQYNLDDFQIIESPNDSSHTFSIDGILLGDGKYDSARVTEKITHKYCEIWAISYLLNDLCRKGVIPAGNYLVNVSW